MTPQGHAALDGGSAVERLATGEEILRERVLPLLDGVKASGGRYMARCPAHEDSKPSLSVSVGKEHPVVLNCFAGCERDAILDKLGLTWDELCKPRQDGPLVKEEWTPHGPAVAVYDYRDEAGNLLFQVLRTADKQFPQRIPDPTRKSGWTWRLGDIRRVPYRLPELIKAVGEGREIYLVEGEKDVENLVRGGYAATTSPGGAGKWRSEYTRYFANAAVTIIADKDKAGTAHAQVIAKALAPVARSVRIVQAADGKDVTDHLEAGNTVDQLVPIGGSQPGSSTWPEDPLPLGWHTDLPPFPVNALPPTIAEYVTGLSGEIQTPLDMAGTVALGVMAACVCGKVLVETRAGHVEPTNQYVVIVAPPASRKSAVVAACRQPLDAAEDRLITALGNQIDDRRLQREILDQYAERMKAAAAKSADRADIAEAVAAATAAREFTVPPKPKLVMGDASPERLIQLLGEHGRMAAISAEAGLIDSMLGRHAKRTNLDPLLKAHVGDRLDNATVARGDERADRPALTLVMSIQPFALEQLTQEGTESAGRGLIARPLWSLTPDIVGSRRWDGSVPVAELVKAAYRTRLSDLAVVTSLMDKPVTLTMTISAAKLYGEYHDRLEALMATGAEHGAGLIREWVGKLHGAVARIAGAIQAVNHPPTLPEVGAGGSFIDSPPDWNPGPIDEATVRDAIEIGEYFRAHAAAALGGGEDQRAPAARQLLNWLVGRKCDSFAKREVLRNGPRSLRKEASLSPALNYLTSLGWLRRREGDGYEIHPVALSLATAATMATQPTVHAKIAGQRHQLGEPTVSPPAATRGDTGIPGLRASPSVANADDTTATPTTSGNSSVSPLSPLSPAFPVPDGDTCPGCGFPTTSNGHAANCA